MTPPDGSDGPEAVPGAPQGRDRRRDFELRARFDRILALRSAWGVLAPTGLWAVGQHITETGRGLNEELKEIASLGMEGRDPAILPRIDGLLDTFEGEMRAIASGLSVAELRSTLTGQGELDRPGVLDLLDLVLGCAGGGVRDGERGGLDDASLQLPLVDCLITILCCGISGNAGAAAVHDPISLTPHLHDLCMQADQIVDLGLREIETDFFAATALAEMETREDNPAREGSDLWKRKLGLGASYFVPRLLRAIVTYNAAVYRRVSVELSTAHDWGGIPGQPDESAEQGSVYESEALPRVAEALRRRMSGGAPSTAAIDRIAWCLDLSYADRDELASLESPSVGTAEDPTGTVILVGLLCRASVVLADELPFVGISPEYMTNEWVRELDEELKKLIQSKIPDAYPEACALTELKSKFLYRSIVELSLQKHRPVLTQTKAEAQEVRKEAHRLAKSAIEADAEQEGARLRAAWSWSDLKSSSAVRYVSAGVAIAAVAALVFVMFPPGDLDRFSRQELEDVSPHLVRGGRTGRGTGTAFVGTIADEWSSLAADEQTKTAVEIVERLRAQGIREIMLYDDDERLRIQALGNRPPKVVAQVPL